MNERRTKIALERNRRDGGIVFRAAGIQWLQARTAELRVGDWGLEAIGDLGGYKRGTLRLPWERVAELHYAPAGRGAIAGLYAREGEWCSRCVLPWVSEQQASEVIAEIAILYPRMAKSSDSALEIAVGQVMEQRTLVRRRWLPALGRRGVAIATHSGRA